MKTRHLAATAVLLAASALAAGCGDAKFHEARHTDVSDMPGSAVRVVTENGSITVDASVPKRPGVEGVGIEADVFATTAERASAVKILSDRDVSGTLQVRAEWPGGRREPSEGCSFKIEIPLMAGAVEASSSNGSIRVSGSCRSVAARTSNGSIDVSAVPGRVDAKTSNGAVTVKLTDENPGPANLETSNGSIRLTVGPAFHGSLTGQWGNGKLDIDVRDPKTGVRIQGTHVDATKTYVTSLGVGGESSHLRTSNGSIYIDSTTKVSDVR